MLEVQDHQTELTTQTTEDDEQISGINGITCLYTLTVNAFLSLKVLWLPLSKNWVPARQWDNEFLNEGHLCEFIKWPIDYIKDRISNWRIQKKV